MGEAYRPSYSLEDYRKSPGVSMIEENILKAGAKASNLVGGLVQRSTAMVLHEVTRGRVMPCEDLYPHAYHRPA